MPIFIAHPRRVAPAVDPRLDHALKQAVLIGLIAILALPAARGHHELLGWMPLWLLGMPLSAWWALHRFRLPRRREESVAAMRPARRRPHPQARRQALRTGPQRWTRAA